MSYCTQDAPEIDKWRDMAGHQKARADALAARLAEAERLLTDTWLLPDGRNPNLEREVWDFFNPPAKAGEDVGRGTLSTRTDDSADAAQEK